MKKILIFAFFLVLLNLLDTIKISYASENNSVCIYFFYSNTCPHCTKEKTFLQELVQKYPIELYEFEIGSSVNANLWHQICKKYNTQPVGVPMTFIGGKVFVGFAYGDEEIFNPQYNAYVGYSGAMEKVVKEYLERGGSDCPSGISNLVNQNQFSTITSELISIVVFLVIFIATIYALKGKIKVKIKKSLITFFFTFLFIQSSLAQSVQVPLIGEIDKEAPIIILGMILGLVDGIFNPCALSVFLFLVAYLMGLGSRRKCLIIGSVYSTMIFIVYALFMFGVLNVIYYIGNLNLIEKIVSIALIIFGIIEIKDFFFYGRWFSLEIPKSVSPYIEKLIKAATVPSALILGLLVSIVEIPCAGAFPFFYTTLLASRGIKGIENLLYILWYNFFFVFPLILLTLIFYFGFTKAEEAEKKRLELRKYMRLGAGIMMIFLGSSILLGWL